MHKPDRNLVPNLIRQRIDLVVHMHKALANRNRFLVLTSIVGRGKEGAVPSEIGEDCGLAPDVVSKALRVLIDAWLVNGGLPHGQKSGRRVFPSRLAWEWYAFEGLGNPADVLRWANEPHATKQPLESVPAPLVSPYGAPWGDAGLGAPHVGSFLHTP